MRYRCATPENGALSCRTAQARSVPDGSMRSHLGYMAVTWIPECTRGYKRIARNPLIYMVPAAGLEPAT